MIVFFFLFFSKVFHGFPPFARFLLGFMLVLPRMILTLIGLLVFVVICMYINECILYKLYW